ncbi:MAG: PilZ domain-containing protein [Candidatus Aminicenantes bacterium]|nr:PilZ domain-containing protein [Candidatus Aminicenantes bacterium]
MDYKGIERRTCIRFEIPGATLNYKKDRPFIADSKQSEEFCPVLDISRGGLRFLTQENLNMNTSIIMHISLPGERVPFEMKGQVKWVASNAGKSYKFQVGVQFSPYGEKKGQNYPGALVKIIALEQKFAPSALEDQDSSEKGDFEIDSE